MRLALLLLAPAAVAGVVLMTAGLSRARNAAHAMLGGLCAAASAMLAWVAVGYSLFSGAGHVLQYGRVDWNVAGSGPLLMHHAVVDEAALFVMIAAALVAVIPLGAGAERWRLGSISGVGALLGGFVFPLFAHWSWGGGWLGGLRFLDIGGSATIHGVGGMAALAVAWRLGPRQGKFTREGIPTAFPGHSAALVLFGSFLSWIGWLALNGAGAMFAGLSPAAAAFNTTVSAAAAGLAVAGLTRLRFGKADASLSANGWTAGLVAASAGCASMAPVGAMATGAAAGVLAAYTVEWLEVRLFIDDPAGAVAVHGVGGLWGVAAAALFGGAPGMAQFVGAATVVGFALPVCYGIVAAVGRRAAPDAERRGLDLHELGAGAYPDFAGHRDD